MRVRIYVSEPLDLLPAGEDFTIEGDVLPEHSHPGRLVVECPPINVVGSTVRWISLTPRYVGTSFDSLTSEGFLTVSGEMRAGDGEPEPLSS